ncbi:MAG: PEP-CTERM sorting domain-containing protein [Dongiaceae bacterium]
MAGIFTTGSVLPFGIGPGDSTAANVFVGGDFNGPATGTMTINGGSVLTTPSPDPQGHLGTLAGSSGTVTVTGTGSAWKLQGVINDGFDDGLGGFLSVGRAGVGQLNVTAGGQVNIDAGATGITPAMLVGANAGGQGTVLIDGTGSKITVDCAACTPTNGPATQIGSAGNGSMTVQNGGTLALTGTDAFLAVGHHTGSVGQLDVTGGGLVSLNGGNAIASASIGTEAGTSGTVNLTNNGQMTFSGGQSYLFVGRNGQGSLSLDSGSSLSLTGQPTTEFSSVGLYVGEGTGGVGNVTLSNGSSLSLTGQSPLLFIGRDGVGAMQVLSGSSVTLQGLATDPADTGIEIASHHTATAPGGSLLVDNASVAVTANQAFINVGTDGPGSLTVRNGGTVTITGTDGYGFLGVGRSGNGTLDIESGGQVTVASATGDSSVFVAQAPGSVGTVIVDGAASKLNAGALLAIGTDFDLASPGGTGTVSVRNGGVIQASQTVIGANGFLGGNGTIVGDVANDGGTVSPGLSPGRLTIDGNYVQNAGQLDIEIAGLAPGQFDVLDVTGTATFTGGSIVLAFESFLPQTGDVLTFLLAQSILGLDSVDLLFSGIAQGFQYDLTSSGGMVRLVALNDAEAVPEPGSMLLLCGGLLTIALVVRRVRPRRAGLAAKSGLTLFYSPEPAL